MYAPVNPETNEFLHVRLFPITANLTTHWFLPDLHRRYQLNGVTFLFDDANHLVKVLSADGYDFRALRHGPRNAIERVFSEAQRRTSSFLNSFSHVPPSTVRSGSKPSPSGTIDGKVNIT